MDYHALFLFAATPVSIAANGMGVPSRVWNLSWSGPFRVTPTLEVPA